MQLIIISRRWELKESQNNGAWRANHRTWEQSFQNALSSGAYRAFKSDVLQDTDKHNIDR